MAERTIALPNFIGSIAAFIVHFCGSVCETIHVIGKGCDQHTINGRGEEYNSSLRKNSVFIG